MLDARQTTFDYNKAEGITLIRHYYMGLGIFAHVQGGFVIADLEGDSPYQVIFFKPAEETVSHLYIPNCTLRFDPTAVADRRQDPPLGSLVVAPQGISLMVNPIRGTPTTLALTGEPPRSPYEGFCVTRWQIESGPGFGKPAKLHEFGSQTSSAP